MKENKVTPDQILDLLSKIDNGWKNKARHYQENKEWLERSAKIATKILAVLSNNRKEQKSPNSQKELADLMSMSPQQVNKFVKGHENLTLETISKLEKALQVQLIFVDVESEVKASDIAFAYMA